MRAGGGAPAVLNAANEIAVAAFLGRRIGFLDIARVVEATLERICPCAAGTLDLVLELDARARDVATGFVTARQAARAA